MIERFGLLNGTLIGTITPGQNGPGNYGNELVLHTPQTLEVEPHHQIKFFGHTKEKTS